MVDITENERKAFIELKNLFADQFMQPRFFAGSDIQFELLESGLDMEDDGVYYRLSASGYLDCTDWHGPFKNALLAIEDCQATYIDY